MAMGAWTAFGAGGAEAAVVGRFPLKGTAVALVKPVSPSILWIVRSGIMIPTPIPKPPDPV
jgi:hypothetical protein